MIDTSLLIERVKLRFTDDESEAVPPDEVISEYLSTIQDRLCIRLDADEVPERGLSLVVEAAVKAIRLRGFEGSRSETAADGGSYSISFIDDVLDAYKDDIASLNRKLHKGGVKFL